MTRKVASADNATISKVAGIVLRHERKYLPPNNISSASIGVTKKKKKMKAIR
jgi:hypothetical protein